MPEMKPQVYLDDRPAAYFDQFHESARKGVGWTYTAARILVTIPTILLYRVTSQGRGNVPKRGAAVLAPNHFSQADHFFVGVYLWRKVRFMAKSQLFGPPVLTYILRVGGVFPVRRGHRRGALVSLSDTFAPRASRPAVRLVPAPGRNRASWVE